jgi:hypothetical protein
LCRIDWSNTIADTELSETQNANYPVSALGLAVIASLNGYDLFVTVMGTASGVSMMAYNLSSSAPTNVPIELFAMPADPFALSSISRLKYDDTSQSLYFLMNTNGSNALYVYDFANSSQPNPSVVFEVPSNYSVLKFAASMDNLENDYSALLMGDDGLIYFWNVSIDGTPVQQFAPLVLPQDLVGASLFIIDIFSDFNLPVVPVPTATPMVDSAVSSSANADDSMYTYIGIGVGVGVCCCLLLILIVIVVLRRRRSRSDTGADDVPIATSSFSKSTKRTDVELQDAGATQYQSITKVAANVSQQRASSFRNSTSNKTQSGLFAIDFSELQ